MNDAATLRAVTKSFAGTAAVARLDLAIPQGCVTGLLGPNGAGKTTTLRLLVGILEPDEGSIQVRGRRPRDARREVGYLPEERGLYPRMRVGEFLVFLARLRRLSDGRGRARDWLARLDLAGAERCRCGELSKGMQQRVQIAAALLHDPPLVLLDEPFSGLDPLQVELTSELIRALRREGRTVVLSTHRLLLAEQLCDRFALIVRGRSRLDTSRNELVARGPALEDLFAQLVRDGGDAPEEGSG